MSYIRHPDYEGKMDSSGHPTNIEQTLVLIKPESIVTQHIVGQIVSIFEQKGLRILAMNMGVRSVDLIRAHYAELVNKPTFNHLVRYMTSGPMIAMVLEGPAAIGVCRMLINPAKALAGDVSAQGGQIPSAGRGSNDDPNLQSSFSSTTRGTSSHNIMPTNQAQDISRITIPSTIPPAGSIRGDHSLSPLFNTVHGSDSRAAAVREIQLWFQNLSAPIWTPAMQAPQPENFMGYPIAPQNAVGPFYTYPYKGPYHQGQGSSPHRR